MIRKLVLRKHDTKSGTARGDLIPLDRMKCTPGTPPLQIAQQFSTQLYFIIRDLADRGVDPFFGLGGGGEGAKVRKKEGKKGGRKKKGGGGIKKKHYI